MVLDTINEIRAALSIANVGLDKLETQLPKPKPLPELGAYIVDNGSYGSALIARLKSYIDVLAKSSFRHVILFQNKQQITQDKFPQYITGKGLTFTLDTMIAVFRTTTPAERAAYMAMAEQLNPRDYRFDDIHNQPPEELAAAVKFMRGYTDKPIYGTLGADDTKKVKNPITGKETTVPVDVQAYVDAGLKITRQFFRHDTADEETVEERTAPVAAWLKAQLPRSKGGQDRIIHGVDLEAFQEGSVTTSPGDFEAMLLKCLNAGIDMLTVHAVVNGQKWFMWQAAPELWQAVQAGAVTVRLWKQ